MSSYNCIFCDDENKREQFDECVICRKCREINGICDNRRYFIVEYLDNGYEYYSFPILHLRSALLEHSQFTILNKF